MNLTDLVDSLIEAGHEAEGTVFRIFRQADLRNPVITEVRDRSHDPFMPRRSDKENRPSGRALAFIAWMKANGTNTKQVAKKADVPYTTLASFVQGATQQLLGGREEQISEKLGVSASELFGGKDSGWIGQKPIPVISSVAAGRLTDPDTQIAGDHPTITIGGLEPGDYFATVVDGTSMDRLSPHGSLIVVNRAERELLPGRRYIFGSRGKTTYKKWEPDPPRLECETTDPETNKTIYPKSEDEWLVIGRVRLTMLRDL